MKQTLRNRQVFISFFTTVSIFLSGFTVKAQVNSNALSKGTVVELSHIDPRVTSSNLRGQKSIAEGKKAVPVSTLRPRISAEKNTNKADAIASKPEHKIKPAEGSGSNISGRKEVEQNNLAAKRDQRETGKPNAGKTSLSGTVNKRLEKGNYNREPDKSSSIPENYNKGKTNK